MANIPFAGGDSCYFVAADEHLPGLGYKTNIADFSGFKSTDSWNNHWFRTRSYHHNIWYRQ